MVIIPWSEYKPKTPNPFHEIEYILKLLVYQILIHSNLYIFSIFFDLFKKTLN